MPESAINLPQALQGDAQRIWQLLTNVGELTIGQIGAIQNGEQLSYNWVDQDTVVFWRSFDDLQRSRLTLSHIRESGYQSIQWEHEEVIGRADEFKMYARIEGFPLDTMYDDTFTHSFGAVETLLDITKDGFETEAKARLGSISTPAGAELAQTVTGEYQKQKGHTDNWEETKTARFTFPIKEDFEIRAVRAQEKRRVHVVGIPMLDYAIEWGRYWGNGSYDKTNVASRDEFLQLLAGNAPNTVGVMYTRRPGEVTWSGMEWPITETQQAAWFRDRAQQGSIDARSQPVSFTREYDAVLSQGFRYYSLKDGEYVDPPKP